MNAPLAPPRATPAPMRSKFHRPNTASPETEQQRILAAMRKDKCLVSITLVTGVSPVGRLAAFDQFTLTLMPPTGNSELLIYKAGVLTIARKLQPPAAGPTA